MKTKKAFKKKSKTFLSYLKGFHQSKENNYFLEDESPTLTFFFFESESKVQSVSIKTESKKVVKVLKFEIRFHRIQSW